MMDGGRSEHREQEECMDGWMDARGVEDVWCFLVVSSEMIWGWMTDRAENKEAAHCAPWRGLYLDAFLLLFRIRYMSSTKPEHGDEHKVCLRMQCRSYQSIGCIQGCPWMQSQRSMKIHPLWECQQKKRGRSSISKGLVKRHHVIQSHVAHPRSSNSGSSSPCMASHPCSCSCPCSGSMQPCM